MTTEDFNRRLTSIENKIDKLTEAVSGIKIQKSRIDGLDSRLSALWEKWDLLADPKNGFFATLNSEMSAYKDSKMTMRWVIIVCGVNSVASAAALFSVAYYVWQWAP